MLPHVENLFPGSTAGGVGEAAVRAERASQRTGGHAAEQAEGKPAQATVRPWGWGGGGNRSAWEEFGG